ncbi:MAG TPA: transglycosylase domain-containing protein [Candidatus Limnocylindria bacterium]|nr:transglycosylase domain-containing protein [Candidatus Limnocylindria bacterium]
MTGTLSGINRQTTRDHALKRGPYRGKRNGKGGGAKLRVVPPALLLALGILIVGLPLAAVASAYAFFAADLPSPQEIARDPLAQSTKVYDRDAKELLYQFEVERREIVTLDQVPQVLIDATIAAEDKSFWDNPGIDVVGLTRAVWGEITRQPLGGGSTITQQLVKQRIVGGEVSYKRKIREAILAVQVTRMYSKREILELYFNQIFYGNQAYGVKAAAEAYFRKSDLSRLTLAEAALLAGLPQAPSVLDPTKERNLDAAKERREYVLDQMVDTGAITGAERDRANAEPIVTHGPPVATIKAPHFVFQVRNQLARILGGDESAVTRGGFKVTTSLDWRLQQIAERDVRENVEALHRSNVWNAALVSMDTRSGEILAYVGSVDYQNREDARVQGQFDVAGIGIRQPGSAFKMFTYLTALKKGATAATVVVDARTDFDGKADPSRLSPQSCGYCPENADLQYHGPVTMRQAIRESRNVPAVKFLQQYAGIAETVQTARDLGITTPIDPAQTGLSLTLGSKEVKLVDMVSSYGVVANLGVRAAPTYILKVEDPRGRVVWEHKDYEQKRVVDEATAYVMVDILKDTTQPSRSFVFGNFTNIGRPAMLKTGTTDNLKDVYAVGATPTLVTGVWMGNSNGEVMSSRDFSSAIGPGQLWQRYMSEIFEGFPALDWKRPANVVNANVVVAPGPFGGYGSGLLPSTLSPFQSSEIFVRGTEPRKQDDWWARGCVRSDGTQGVGIKLLEGGPEVWKRYREQWSKDANAGRHSYNRYTWNVVLDEPCPSPSPSPSPTPSPSGPPASPTRTPPSGQRTPEPTFTLPPWPSGVPRPPTPSPTLPPGQRP